MKFGSILVSRSEDSTNESSVLPTHTRQGSGEVTDSHVRQIVRFVVVGGLNTAITAILFLILAGFTAYPVAYLISYTIGVAFNVYVVPRFVFKRQPKIPTLGRYVVWNIVIAIVGSVLAGFCQNLGLNRLIALIVVMAIVVPINFLVSRKILSRDPHKNL